MASGAYPRIFPAPAAGGRLVNPKKKTDPPPRVGVSLRELTIRLWGRIGWEGNPYAARVTAVSRAFWLRFPFWPNHSESIRFSVVRPLE